MVKLVGSTNKGMRKQTRAGRLISCRASHASESGTLALVRPARRLSRPPPRGAAGPLRKADGAPECGDF